MYAEILLLNTDSTGHLINLPVLPANTRIEAIFLVLDDNNKSTIIRNNRLSTDQSETIAFANHSASNIAEWMSSEEDAIWN
jgi:hypothetical protein